MDFILDRLAIGGIADAKNIEKLRQEGIRAILNVAIEWEYEVENFRYLKVPIEDGYRIPFYAIDKSVDFIWSEICQGGILIHCNLGLSRSPAIVMCYLWRCGFSLSEALQIIRTKREVYPHPKILASVYDYCGEQILDPDWELQLYMRYPLL
jgi:protein-tyrosine phosphatase